MASRKSLHLKSGSQIEALLAISDFGAGSIMMAKIPDPLSATVGLPMTFVILGCFHFSMMVICAFVFRVPLPGYVINGLNVLAVRVDGTDQRKETCTQNDTDAENLGLRCQNTNNESHYPHPLQPAPRRCVDAGLSRLSRSQLQWSCNSARTVIQLVFLSNTNTASAVVPINGGFNPVAYAMLWGWIWLHAGLPM
ncbi:hypothetical protein BGX20_000743 [Mortierella sp. AD010]|nr:hypothetical protein BGX20_000743 [Mortierella sp. AD010]